MTVMIKRASSKEDLVYGRSSLFFFDNDTTSQFMMVASQGVDVELARHFLGVARIPMSAVTFDRSDDQHRSISQERVEHLKNFFTKDVCKRHDPLNFASALVDTDALEAAVSGAGLTTADLRQGSDGSIPALNMNVSCVEGFHRISAALAILSAGEGEQWWSFRLYSSTLPRRCIAYLAERTSNELQYADGDIVLKILGYRRRLEADEEQRWWARLSRTKQCDLRQLFRDEQVLELLLQLSELPGLWPCLQVGQLHRYHSLKCKDEILNGLRHLLETWRAILANSNVDPAVVDTQTVSELELLAPASSRSDAHVLEAALPPRTAFRLVADGQQRDQIKANLMSQSFMIPSLRSFFEDLKYLETCAGPLKKLLGSTLSGSSLRDSLFARFQPPTCALIETAAERYASCDAVPDVLRRSIPYIQLWLFCLRNFPLLTALTPRKENGKRKPPCQGPNEDVQAVFHHFATQGGFSLPSCGGCPGNAELQRVAPGDVMLTCDSLPLGKDRRCGRPFEDDHFSSLGQLFLPQLLNAPVGPGTHITPLFVKFNFLCVYLELDKITLPNLIDQVPGEARPADVPTAGVDSRGSVDPAFEADVRLRQLADELAAAKSRMGGLQERADALDATASKLADELAAANSRLSTLQVRADTSDATASKLDDELGAAQSMMGSLQMRVDASEAAASKLADELAAAKSQMGGLQVRADASDAINSQLQSCQAQLELSRRENEDSRQVKLAAQSNLEACLERCRSLEAQVEQRQCNDRPCGDEPVQTDDQLNKCQHCAELVAKLQDCQSRDLRAAHDLKTAHGEVQSLREQCALMTTKTAELSTELQGCKSREESCARALKTLQTEAQGVREQHTGCASASSKASEETRLIQGEKSMLEERLWRSRRENQFLSDQLLKTHRSSYDDTMLQSDAPYGLTVPRCCAAIAMLLPDVDVLQCLLRNQMRSSIKLGRWTDEEAGVMGDLVLTWLCGMRIPHGDFYQTSRKAMLSNQGKAIWYLRYESGQLQVLPFLTGDIACLGAVFRMRQGSSGALWITPVPGKIAPAPTWEDVATLLDGHSTLFIGTRETLQSLLSSSFEERLPLVKLIAEDFPVVQHQLSSIQGELLQINPQSLPTTQEQDEEL